VSFCFGIPLPTSLSKLFLGLTSGGNCGQSEPVNVVGRNSHFLAEPAGAVGIPGGANGAAPYANVSDRPGGFHGVSNFVFGVAVSVPGAPLDQVGEWITACVYELASHEMRDHVAITLWNPSAPFSHHVRRTSAKRL